MVLRSHCEVQVPTLQNGCEGSPAVPGKELEPEWLHGTSPIIHLRSCTSTHLCMCRRKRGRCPVCGRGWGRGWNSKAATTRRVGLSRGERRRKVASCDAHPEPTSCDVGLLPGLSSSTPSRRAMPIAKALNQTRAESHGWDPCRSLSRVPSRGLFLSRLLLLHSARESRSAPHRC